MCGCPLICQGLPGCTLAHIPDMAEVEQFWAEERETMLKVSKESELTDTWPMWHDACMGAGEEWENL